MTEPVRRFDEVTGERLPEPPQLMSCPRCQGRFEGSPNFCPHCGLAKEEAPTLQASALQPATPAPPSITYAAPSNSKRDVFVKVALGAAVATGVGSALPWATVSAPFIGTVSKNGLDGDGVITLVAAVIAGALIVSSWSGGNRGRWIGVGVLGLAITGIGIIDAADIKEQFRGEEMIYAAPGIGLYLTILSGIALSTVAWKLGAEDAGWTEPSVDERFRVRRRPPI